jgi:hypothetical protein
MKGSDIVLLLVLGLIIWVAGTIYYAICGHIILETTSLRYWRMMIISAISSTVICFAILRWRNIAPVNWTSAMLLIALPGMVGEAVLLTNLTRFMPRLQSASGGKYGALLFATYALALGLQKWCR